MGAIFRFLGLCVCLGVQRGLSRVLIKYSGNVRLQTIKYWASAKATEPDAVAKGLQSRPTLKNGILDGRNKKNISTARLGDYQTWARPADNYK